LAQQHFENFKDRFADWPVRIELLSRFQNKREQDQITTALKAGFAHGQMRERELEHVDCGTGQRLPEQ
ncbi:MAG: hypothetical protein M3461_06740, partial [Pseudomonadota bacterium]|nr:hypothetical protein [Pseudomonadota bacterium]